MKYTASLATVLLTLLFSGCSEPTTSGEYRDELTVSGFLFAGRGIDSILVQRTAKIDGDWSPEQVAIRNATVIITGNGIVDTLRYDSAQPGRYYSMRTDNIIKPQETYLLRVMVPGYPDVTGSTTVPGPTRITNREELTDTLRYNSGVRLFKWEESPLYADYVISVRSLDMKAEKTRDDNPHDNGEDTDNYRINRTVYFFGFQGMKQTEIPWFVFRYYGRNSITFSAIDENYYDYIKQLGMPSTDIRDIRYRLHGALGVFGSAYADTMYVTITK